CTGMQHEGSRKNGLRIDNILEDGGESTDLARTINFKQNYFTGCGSVDDHSPDSYGVYIANGDGIELDTPTFNLSRNGIGFDAQNVDNLLIRRPHFLVAERQEVESHFRQTHRRRALFTAQAQGMSRTTYSILTTRQPPLLPILPAARPISAC
ncbi:hypothetical protein, partial [Klebsiella pneumoniae]